MSKILWVSSLYDFLDGYVCSITVILVEYGPGRMNRWLDLSILNQVLIPIAIFVLNRETWANLVVDSALFMAPRGT